MSLQYRVYVGVNGPPDYSSPAVTTSSLTASIGPFGGSSTVVAVVRAFDAVSGLEDTSTDARVVVLIDSEGEDATGFPLAPVGLSVRATAGGNAIVSFSEPLNGGARGFHVFIGTPVPDYSTPVASIAYDRGSPGAPLSATISGLSDGVTYAVGVRAFNAIGEEQNTTVAFVTGKSTGPLAVVPLSASAVP